MRWMRSVLVIMVMIMICFIVTDLVLAQCPMCRTSLLNSPEGQQMASGFNTGILFLLSAPFVVVGAIGFLISNTCRRRKVTRWGSVKEPITKPPKENEMMKKYLNGEFIKT